jgi:hypothetical protein
MERRTVQKNPMSLQVGRTWPEGAIAFDPRPKRQLPNLGDRKSNLREMSRHLNPSIGKGPHLLRVGNPLFAWPWKRYSLHCLRIPVKWATDSGDVGQGRSEATLVVFLQ